MTFKLCKVCLLEKSYDKSQKYCSKASGFYAAMCWGCYQDTNAKRQAAYRATTEGLHKHRATSLACYYAARAVPAKLAQIQKHARESSLAWAKKYPEKINAKNMKRHAAKLQRVPPWANLEAIAQVYVKATEQGLAVDHIIPLQGTLVSGLHVASNLQLLSKTENSSKGNRYEV